MNLLGGFSDFRWKSGNPKIRLPYKKRLKWTGKRPNWFVPSQLNVARNELVHHELQVCYEVECTEEDSMRAHSGLEIVEL